MSPPGHQRDFISLETTAGHLSQLSYPYILPQLAPEPNDTIQQLPAGFGPAYSCFTLRIHEDALPSTSFKELFSREVGS